MRALLDKLLRRTKRDVALAGAMCGSVSAMSKLFPKIEKYSTLAVYFYGGSSLDWTWAPVVPGPSAFQDFLRWYHGRPQSECYVMVSRQGSTMFRRCDIRGYAITNGERESQSAALDRMKEKP